MRGVELDSFLIKGSGLGVGPLRKDIIASDKEMLSLGPVGAIARERPPSSDRARESRSAKGALSMTE